MHLDWESLGEIRKIGGPKKSVFHYKKGKNRGKESGQSKNLKNFDQEILGGSLEIAKKSSWELE